MGKNVKSHAEWLAEQEDINLDEDSLNEASDMVDIDIMIQDEPESIADELGDIEGVTGIKVTNYGVIKAKTKRGQLGAIQRIKGVEKVIKYK